MANKIEIDVIANDLASAALDLVRNKLLDMGGKAALVGTAALTMGAAIVTGLNKAKDAAYAYDQQVKELMLRTGGTAEETSRLIQTVDDAGISYETLTTAMKFAVKNGIEPNIKSIAQLSTEYLALNTPVERGQFLLEKFGRSGMDMARIMDMGGDAIMRMSGAVSENLIVTDEAIKQSEEYRVNVDNLTDSWEGLKVMIGNEVIPALNDSLSGMTNWNNAMERAATLTGTTDQRLNQVVARMILMGDVTNSATVSYTAWAQSLQNTGDTMTAIEPNYQQMLSLTQQLEGATAQAMQSMSYNMLMTKLSADGLTQAEYEMGVQAGVAMGIFSQRSADMAVKMNAMTEMVIRGRLNVELLKGAIESLRSRDIEINVAIMNASAAQFQSSQQASQAANPEHTYNTPGRAAGGPVMAGRAYTVGEVGQELFVPNTSGTIIPNNQLGGTVVNLTYAPAFSAGNKDEFQNILLPFIIEGIRQAQLR